MSFRLFRVKFLSPTNTKGSRYSVAAFGRRLTVPADYSLTPEENARAVLLRALDGRPVEYVSPSSGTSSDFAFMVRFAESYRLTFTLE